ncbi:hypothetical protein [Streptomyces sp. NPDC020667]|uniref:hypothetical protein n=1 Tax=Streptomyces sp. NPDC020667 TaxID=3154895 RepID=UPI0033DA49B9
MSKQQGPSVSVVSTVALCGECAEPLSFDVSGSRFVCGNGQCAMLGMDLPVWRVLKRAGLAVPGVVGLPRPVYRGMPVPWIAPVAADGRVWFRALDGERLARAQSEWLCQLCGEALSDEAWVFATPEGLVLQAALHEGCKDIASGFCPHLSGPISRAVPRPVTCEEISADGRPLPVAGPSDPDFPQQWRIL